MVNPDPPNSLCWTSLAFDAVGGSVFGAFASDFELVTSIPEFVPAGYGSFSVLVVPWAAA